MLCLPSLSRCSSTDPPSTLPSEKSTCQNLSVDTRKTAWGRPRKRRDLIAFPCSSPFSPSPGGPTASGKQAGYLGLAPSVHWHGADLLCCALGNPDLAFYRTSVTVTGIVTVLWLPRGNTTLLLPKQGSQFKLFFFFA